MYKTNKKDRKHKSQSKQQKARRLNSSKIIFPRYVKSLYKKITTRLHSSNNKPTNNKTHNKRNPKPKTFLRSINYEFRFRLFSIHMVFILIITISTFTFFLFYLVVLGDIPSINSIRKHDPELTTTIYDRKGNVLYRQYSDIDRELVRINDIPQNIINATIAIEDQDFYKHNGISFSGIARAAKKNVFDERLEGGSTITQQLVKNVLLTPGRTIKRKLKEIVLALEIEHKYSKNEILEMYLNSISYGGTAYGINSASKKYFGKDLENLTLAESAYLAGLPAAPSTYSPFGSRPEYGKYRQKDVLSRMVEDNYITSEEASRAYSEKLQFAKQLDKIIAPHFVTYTLSYLEKKYGQKLIQQGGLEVYTSLDPELQSALEDVVEKNVKKLENNNVTNGAAIITNPKTGEILAMVGSVNFWDIQNDGNVNVTISPRQPGSSIKPLMYAMALENGYTLSTIINDSPVSYNIIGQKAYSPKNYDGKFHGNVSLKIALASSYNVPAVKVLNTLGVTQFIEHASKMGISTWKNKPDYGLSVTLGAGEVKMTDMAVAYGVFANGGYRRNLTPVLKIYDPYGILISENDCVNLLKESPSILTRKVFFDTHAYASNKSKTEYPQNCYRQKVVEPSTAYLISDTLSNNYFRTPAFGLNSALNIKNKQVAVKTGTTQNLKDNWAIGYTNDYVVAAWVGNNDGATMKNIVSGYSGASIIWRETFDYIIKNRDVKDKIAMPSGLIEVEICPTTNTLACPTCKNEKRVYKKGEEPRYHCTAESLQQKLDDLQKSAEELESGTKKN